MPRQGLARYDFLISRRRYDPQDTMPEDQANAYGLWRFDPDSAALVTPVKLEAGARFDRRHALVQIGNYLLEWGPIQFKPYGGLYPYRLFMFDPNNGDPLGTGAKTVVQQPYGPQTVSTAVQKGSWPKSKFWAYRPDFGNPQGAHEGFDSGEQLLLIPLGSWLLNVIPTDGRGTFQLWNFDPAPLTPGSHDPLPAPYQPQGSFDYVDFGHELIPMGNYVIDRIPDTGDWQVLSFDPQNPQILPQPAIRQGRFADIDATHQLVPIGDLLLDWTPTDRGYRLWRFDARQANPFVGPLRSGTLPAQFDAMTTLTAVQPRVPIDPARARQPGTIDFMRSRIRHVVYLMLENRSFDHVLGWLYDVGKRDGRGIHFVGDERPFDGASTAMFNVDPSMGGQKVFLAQYQDGRPSLKTKIDFLPNDPYHDKTDVMRQFFYGQADGYSERAKPGMGGFVWNNGVHEVMWTYTPEQLPVINGLAREFAVSDAWFCSMPSATDPNRAFAFTGSALTTLNNFQNGVQYQYWPYVPRRQSIWKLLWSQGITDWKLYHSVLWLNFVHSYHLFLQGQVPTVDASVANFLFPIEQFKADALAGKLPAFSHLEPAWIAPQGTTSYHPGADLVPGERALADLYEAVRAGPAWNETLFVITFDEHGGIFDHASPPYAVNPWPLDQNDGFRYDLLGPRVPAIVISPWIERQTVFRSGEDIAFDHTSVLSTLLQWFGVPRSRWAMGDRVDAAPSFETVLTRRQPRKDAPLTLERPSDLLFPPDGASGHPLPVHDLHRLMAPRLVWHLVQGRLPPREAQQLSEQILAGAQDLQSLYQAVAQVAQAYGGGGAGTPT
jgi:phospholipase C